MSSSAASLLRDLTPAQAAAVEREGEPVCILAGAGSGKTRVLTRRIAHRIATGRADASHTLVVTFTRRAAGELGRRLSRLGVRSSVTAGTFHALAYAALRRHWADTGRPAPALLERKVALLTGLLRSSGAGAGAGADVGVAALEVAGEIEWAKARVVPPEGYERAALAAGRRPPLPAGALASVYGRYEAEKRRRGVLDFDDLLLRAGRLFLDDPSFAAKERWRHRHLFVDELQDVNPAQWRLLEGWLGDRLDLCVVGDPDQAVYGWNGADPGFLTGFPARFPGATVLTLEDNFRSSPQVLAVADAVLAPDPGRRSPLVAHRPDGPIPPVRAYASAHDEAVGTARAVRAAKRPSGWWSDVAVLTRTNAQVVVLQEAMVAAGIPCRVRNGRAFLRRPEVQLAVDGLARGSAPFPMWLADLEAEVRAHLAEDEADPAAERWAHLAELARLGRSFLGEDGPATGPAFLGWLSLQLRDDGPGASEDGVELASFHAAKGLEWPVVFLAGLEEGLVPIAGARTEAAQAEERRLLYVAATRAERELHCSWARTRTFGERTVEREPSPWLADVEAARAALAAGGRAGDLRARVAEERRRLAVEAGDGRVGAGAHQDVLVALRAWRSAAARAAGVPAHVLVHDTTLAAVAEARPRTRDGLLALPGLGPVKADRFGDALLDVVATVAS